MYNHQLIKTYMENGRYTIQSLSVEIGLSTNTVSRARAGGNLSVETLKAIADAIGLPMQLLFAEATVDARSNGASRRTKE